MSKVKPTPDGYHSVTPYLVVKGAEKVIDFAKAVFDAEEIERFAKPDGSIMHAEFRIGDSVVMIGEAPEQPMPATLHVYVPNADLTYKKALAAGGKSLREPTDQFYGDRSAGVTDSAGNQWWMATHVEDVSKDEMKRRMAEQSQG